MDVLNLSTNVIGYLTYAIELQNREVIKIVGAKIGSNLEGEREVPNYNHIFQQGKILQDFENCLYRIY